MVTARTLVTRAAVVVLVAVVASIAIVRAPLPVAADPILDEAFVVHAYEDFLGRTPTDAEVAWWVTYLTTGSRTVVLSSLLDGSEFVDRFSSATYLRYLDRPATATERAADRSAIAAGASHVSLEVARLASGAFYAASGGTSSGFVNLLYAKVVDRAPDASGLSYYVGKLASGSSRSWVATSVIRGSEAAGLRVRGKASATACPSFDLAAMDDVLAGSYCLILDRMGDPSGSSYWTNQMAGSGDLPDLWTALAAGGEYYANS